MAAGYEHRRRSGEEQDVIGVSQKVWGCRSHYYGGTRSEVDLSFGAPDNAEGPFQSNATFVPCFRIKSVQEARARDPAREEKKAAREAKQTRDGKKRKHEVRYLCDCFACFLSLSAVCFLRILIRRTMQLFEK